MVQNYFWSLLNHISSLPLLNKTQKQNDCSSYLLLDICDALHNFVPFVQLQKCEKHPWRILGAAGQDLHFYKKDSIQVFSCEFYEIIKNILFTKHLKTTPVIMITKKMKNIFNFSCYPCYPCYTYTVFTISAKP